MGSIVWGKTKLAMQACHSTPLKYFGHKIKLAMQACHKAPLEYFGVKPN